MNSSKEDILKVRADKIIFYLLKVSLDLLPSVESLNELWFLLEEGWGNLRLYNVILT